MTAESAETTGTSTVDGDKSGSHFAFDDDDEQNTNSSQQPTNTSTIHPTDSLSETLNTEYLDIESSDSSCGAIMIRCIASGVGFCCTPSRMLVSMRILKAVTFSFLVLTIVADVMYVFFVDIMSSVGDDGLRGMMARGYGVILSVLALLLELDVHRAVVLFPGFKGFIPRALLLFLIAVITNVGQPDYSQSSSSSSAEYSSYNGGRRSLSTRVLANNYYGYNNNNEEENAAEQQDYYNNEMEGNEEQYYQNGGEVYYANQNAEVDDGYYSSSGYNASGYDEGFFQNLTPQGIEESVPMSAVIFQIVTSWVL
jgi:hypothetical protein